MRSRISAGKYVPECGMLTMSGILPRCTFTREGDTRALVQPVTRDGSGCASIEWNLPVLTQPLAIAMSGAKYRSAA